MILYSPKITPRLLFIANWAGHYLFARPMHVTDSLTDILEDDFILNYSGSELATRSFHIVPFGLLEETTIRPQNVGVLIKGDSITLFPGDGTLGFDLLSAAFYFLSRYEEYLPHETDSYGRYAHTNSLAYKYGFLNRPLVDEWMREFRVKLSEVFPSLVFAEREPLYLPTYDIDIAWSFKNKGFTRNLSGFFKDVATGNTQNIKERISVLSGKKPDPFDVFEELDQLHQQNRLNPIYFMLLAKKPAGYDKNILPSNKQNRVLLQKLAGKYRTGIHLSWKASSSEKVMEQESGSFKEITGEKPFANRMHYINFHLPGTFEQLISIGIKEDYSMGYGSINGFRAGTCTPFQWYNLASETSTSLTIFPFCYMEANSIFEQKDDPATGLAEMQHFHDCIIKHGGVFISIFHNHLVGLNKTGRAWMRIYRCFLEKNYS
jgi:hypothetical protein